MIKIFLGFFNLKKNKMALYRSSPGRQNQSHQMSSDVNLMLNDGRENREKMMTASQLINSMTETFTNLQNNMTPQNS